MRILLVTFAFPPYNNMSAVRVGKTAKYLYQQGHDIRVLTARDLVHPPDLPLEIPAERRLATRWIDVGFLYTAAVRAQRHVARQGGVVALERALNLRRLLKQALHSGYRTVFLFPDGAIGWYPFAVAAGRRLLREWRPDLILASSGAPTGMLVAATLHRQTGVPWVAELQDLWTDNHYHRYPAWRHVLETWMERRALRSARGLVAVTQPMARKLRDRYGKPTAIVLNGFDEADYPAAAPEWSPDLRIVYTGTIYPGKQSARPLFEALRLMGPRAERIRAAFYGAGGGYALAEARAAGVDRLVELHGMVSYHESLRQQRAADALLLLLWNDAREEGIYTGKLFEYLGARRPILAIGADRRGAGDLIRERQAGVVFHDPDQLARQLDSWLEQKARAGVLDGLSASVGAGLSRREQTLRLETFLCELMVKS